MSSSDDAANSVERLKTELKLANEKINDLENELSQFKSAFRTGNELMEFNKDLYIQITQYREKEVTLNEELFHAVLENSKLKDENASLKIQLKSLQPHSNGLRNDEHGDYKLEGNNVDVEMSDVYTEEKVSNLNKFYEEMSHETILQNDDKVYDTSEEINMKADSEYYGYGLKVEIEQDGNYEIDDFIPSTSQAKETIYQCSECKHFSNDPDQIRDHRQTEHGITVIPKVFGNGKRKKRASKYDVNITEVNIKPIKTLKENHKKKGSYHCIFCDYNPIDLDDHKHHKKVVHRFESQHYPCDRCNYVGKFANNLKIHIDAVHAGVKHPCEECDKVFSNPGGLNKHKNAIHRKICHPCKQCDKTFLKTDSLKQHVDRVHKGIRFYCDKCPFAGTTTDYLKKHVAREHTGKRKINPKSHFCEQCGFGTSSITHLKEHIAVQHEGKVYNCDQCTFVTKHRESLKYHQDNKHENIKHKCDHCDMSFTLVNNLKKHQNKTKQGNGKTYSCDICGFTSCLGIRWHKRREHSNVDEQLPCDRCDKMFSSKSYLKIHKKSKHMLLREQCDECDQGFADKQNLSRHKQAFHSLKVETIKDESYNQASSY